MGTQDLFFNLSNAFKIEIERELIFKKGTKMERDYMKKRQNCKKNIRVNWPVTKHLSIQSRPNPKGGSCCFWHPNKT